MSNAKTAHGLDCAPSSPWLSATPLASSDGATTTRFDSTIRSCTPGSNAQQENSGKSRQAQAPEGADPSILAGHIGESEYLDQVADIAERLNSAPDQATVMSLLHEGMAALGAESAIFVSFLRETLRVSSCRFMLACDPAWCRQYLEAGLFARDPWLAYASNHSEPVLASTLKVSEADQLRSIELASRSGFASAVLVPVHSGSSHTRIGLLCLGSSQPGRFEGISFGRFKLGARLLACELHEWLLACLRSELLTQSRISEADLALLRHEHLGHSSKRIAAELGVSPSSINSRFQRMNSRLGVANRKTAARLAAECGLILP
jgi:DNA-binding CsgD family transcriptional regulator